MTTLNIDQAAKFRLREERKQAWKDYSNNKKNKRKNKKIPRKRSRCCFLTKPIGHAWEKITPHRYQCVGCKKTVDRMPIWYNPPE
jgi:hypothetical protein